MTENQQFQVLHISDLHIRDDEDFDRSIVLDPLIKRIREDGKKGMAPEIVLVSGDIAFKGNKKEYDLAKKFFDDLLESLHLGNDRIFIVPGNHDVNRKKYRPSDVPAYENMQELNTELESSDYRSDLLKGMSDYFSFIERNYPHLEAINQRLVPFITSYEAECGKTVGIVGLNSAWMCRKSSDERQIAIGEYQIKNAMKRLHEKGAVDLQICIFHHPLSWLWPEERKICRSYFNNTILLCGHLHEPSGGYTEDLDGRFYQFQAGGAYLGSESGWPCRYQYVTFEWRENLIKLDFRKFVKDKRKWSLDSETGDDGRKFFPMTGIKTEEITPSGAAVIDLEMPEIYFEWLTENYGHMDADKLQGKGQAIPLKLPEIFIPLYAYQTETGPAHEAYIREEKQKPVDIEKIIAKNDVLLIEGQAGSGKTTLLKHLAYCLALQDSNECPIEGLGNFLPVLILLKDLEEFFREQEKDHRTSVTAEEILAWHLKNKVWNILDLSAIRRFLAFKKVIFLFDGLDEISPDRRDMVVNVFSGLIIRNKGNRLVFTGRPHGLEGEVIKRYGAKQVKILSLDMEQVNLFITKWFTYLYPGTEGLGGKTAEAMIGEIKGHPAIEQLIDNPLMLTAICILYHDGKELPGQRAELYKKFIDNLLYRRFKGPEMVHDFLKILAFKMQEEGVRSIDKSFAVRILKGSYKIREDEKEREYTKRIDRVFDDIEPKCGLLKFENGQYTFWHLTFQEFLAAHYLVDNHTDYDQAIKSYWDQERYKEVVELFIGYLSMENKKWANQIISQALQTDDKSPFKKWRLASCSLVDIHRDRREEPVLDVAKGRLLTVMDNTNTEPKKRADAGETLGWLGDPRNLKEFVKVRGGEYTLEGFGAVSIKPFEISKYPITNSWFEEFIKAGGYEKKDLWTVEGRKWLEYTKAKHPRYWDDRKWRCPNLPLVGVSWYEACAFTRWFTVEMNDGKGYRLPNEKEWQTAAAGVEGRLYPWGDKWDKNKYNCDEIKIEKTSPVGVFQNGDTPEGISDLSGNVWEWTLSDYHSKKVLDDFTFDETVQRLIDEEKFEEAYSNLGEKRRQLPVIRGGSWDYASDYCRCASRYYFCPSSRFHLYIGFRCARI